MIMIYWLIHLEFRPLPVQDAILLTVTATPGDPTNYKGAIDNTTNSIQIANDNGILWSFKLSILILENEWWIKVRLNKKSN